MWQTGGSGYLDEQVGVIHAGDPQWGATVRGVKVFCLFGQGDNGKTTLLEIFRYVLGDYATQILVDTLMTKRHAASNASLADLADLRGARFVTTTEADEGGRLAEAKLKYLTGMGEIKTCRKYENPIKFPPTHKILMDANHRPIVRGTDKAIWGRLKPIPFTVSIPEQEQDKALLEKLKQEAPGILVWAAYGCLDWQREGLGDPPEVQDEVAHWKEENDPLGDFVEDCCVIRPDAIVKSAELWAEYLKWAEDARERHTLSRQKFADRLRALGCQDKRVKSTRSWHKIALRTDESEELGRCDG